MPRVSFFQKELLRTLLVLCSSVVAGALAGAIAGWSVDSWQTSQRASLMWGEGMGANTTSTPRTPDVTVIPVERRPQASLVPAPFEGQRSSSVAGVYAPTRVVDGGLLTEDDLVTQAVGVTTDGWFVVPAAAIEGVRTQDLVVWYEGQTATATRAIVDDLSGVVFLDTPFSNVNAPAFARASDVTAGLAAWLERRARRFEPVGVAALRAPAQSLAGVSSERAAREGILTGGRAEEGDVGAPVWSVNGALVGLVVSEAGEALRYLPASAWSASLSSLLATGEIRHASLGVHGVDLAWARVVRIGPDALPVRGALLADGVLGASREPAVLLNSPAANAGLRKGDVIERVDRDILDGSADLGELLADYRPGSHVTLTVRRDGATLDLPVTLGSIVTGEER